MARRALSLGCRMTSPGRTLAGRPGVASAPLSAADPPLGPQARQSRSPRARLPEAPRSPVFAKALSSQLSQSRGSPAPAPGLARCTRTVGHSASGGAPSRKATLPTPYVRSVRSHSAHDGNQRLSVRRNLAGEFCQRRAELRPLVPSPAALDEFGAERRSGKVVL